MNPRIYIDPGVRCTGLANFCSEGRLHDALAFRADTLQEACMHARSWGHEDSDDYRGLSFLGDCAELQIERPQIYAAGKQSGDQNDLISIAIVAGAWATQSRHPVRFVLPNEWKGNLPKEQVHDRMWGALDAREQEILRESVRSIGKLAHNVYDAVSMGLVCLERMRIR